MSILRTISRLLVFRIMREEMLDFKWTHFWAGLLGTWLVGMGRYLDNPRASVLQHLGLGSLIYIFCLSLFIRLIVKPFFVKKWEYFTVLTFISLTSFPAVLYAIPVEKMFTLGAANTINTWFLLIVATWRLCLLFFFLKRSTGLSYGYIVIITLMPICLIIVTLTFLNLDRAVFDMMGGFQPGTSHDAAYRVLFVLSLLSIVLVVPLLIAYLVGVVRRSRERDK